MAFIANIVQYALRNRMMIYVAIGAVIIAFLGGASLGWKVKGHFQMSANMKAISKDLKIGEELDEIRNNPPDSYGLRDLLRNGKY